MLLEMFVQHLGLGGVLPNKIAVVVGGYYMPSSAENTLQKWLASRGTEAHFLHGFGMAEVDFGVLLGTERAEDGWVVYRRASETVSPRVVGGRLSLCVERGGRVAEFDTGDMARQDSRGVAVISSPSRLHPATHSELESWSSRDWERRTGYLSVANGQRLFQLRQGILPTGEDELRFHDFCAFAPMAWTEKPDWAQEFVRDDCALQRNRDLGTHL